MTGSGGVWISGDRGRSGSSQEPGARAAGDQRHGRSGQAHAATWGNGEYSLHHSLCSICLN